MFTDSSLLKKPLNIDSIQTKKFKHFHFCLMFNNAMELMIIATNNMLTYLHISETAIQVWLHTRPVEGVIWRPVKYCTATSGACP